MKSMGTKENKYKSKYKNYLISQKTLKNVETVSLLKLDSSTWKALSLHKFLRDNRTINWPEAQELRF